MPNITIGRCLCGDIEFQFVGEPNCVSHCHCESCRRNTSSLVATFVGVPRCAYKFLKGVTICYESSPGVRRHFCGRCGTPMAFDADKHPEEIHFYLASLVDPEKFVPECHVHHEEKLRWFEILDELPRYNASRSYNEGKTEKRPIGYGPQTT